MSTTPLVVNGTTYNFPNKGQDPDWAAEVTRWATDVTFVLNTIIGIGDIAETTTTIGNNQTSATNVLGLKLFGANVKHAIIQYSIFRQHTVSSVVLGFSETGTIIATLNEFAATNLWNIAHNYVGDTQTLLTITDDGQFKYTSSNLTGTLYSGKMIFTVTVLNRS